MSTGAEPTLAVTPRRSRAAFLRASPRNAIKSEASTVVTLVFPSIVVFLKKKHLECRRHAGQRLAFNFMAEGRQTRSLTPLCRRVHPSLSRPTRRRGLRCAMTRLAPLLPPRWRRCCPGFGNRSPESSASPASTRGARRPTGCAGRRGTGSSHQSTCRKTPEARSRTCSSG